MTGIAVAAVAATVVMAAARWRGGTSPEARHEGRSVRSWFLELCQAEAEGRAGAMADYRTLEARTALLELGTNAVPFLVEEAFVLRSDSLWRTNLSRLTRVLPRWLVGSGVVLWGDRRHQAFLALRRLRPPAGVLLPRLESSLTLTNILPYRQAMFLLGTVGEGADLVMPHLAEAIRQSHDPWLRTLALQSLAWLDPPPSGCLPLLLECLREDPGRHNGLRTIARLGPAAAEAAPWIETLLTNASPDLRASAVVTLLEIVPSHAAAVRLAEEMAQADPDTRRALWFALSRIHRRRCDELLPWLEPMARAEVDAWGPAGASFFATSTLERIAPERAARLYREALEGPGALHAARGLLRLERTNTVVAAEVVRRHDDASSLPGRAVELSLLLDALSEASSQNAPAVDFLEARSRDRVNPARADDARAALARLRYRELREARGLGAEW